MSRNMVARVAAPLIGLAVLGRGMEAQGQPADGDSVRTAAATFYAALNARDIRAMEALWAEDANPVMIHPSGPYARSRAIGMEAIRRSFAEAWPHFAEWSVKVNDMQVRVG